MTTRSNRQRSTIKTNIILIQYVIISGIPKESTGGKIISNFRHTWGISKARFSKVVRGFFYQTVVTRIGK